MGNRTWRRARWVPAFGLAACLLISPQTPANAASPDDLPDAVVEILGEVAAGLEIETVNFGPGGLIHIGGAAGEFQLSLRLAGNGQLLQVGRAGANAGFPIGPPRDGHPIRPDRLPDDVVEGLEELLPDFDIETALRIGGHRVMFCLEGESADGAAIHVVMTHDGLVVEFNIDHDRDGVGDAEEIERGWDPMNEDSDGDLFPDGVERDRGGNPMDPSVGARVIDVRYDAESRVVIATVDTFEGCNFQLEVRKGRGEWVKLGEPICGNGQVSEFAVPVEGPGGGALFRVKMNEPGVVGHDPGAEGPSGDECIVPQSLVGRELVVDGGKRLCFKSETRGEIIEGGGGGMMITPFAYTFERRDNCEAKLRLVFNTHTGFETTVYTLTFGAGGVGGAFVASEVEDGHAEPSGGGNFTISMIP